MVSSTLVKIGKAMETRSEEETLALARRLASHLRPGDWIALTGGLGTGKTTFVRGLAQGLGITEPAVSPTFSLIQFYKNKRGAPPLHHVDLYRLSEREVPALEWEELEDFTGVTVIEWAEKAKMMWPDRCLPLRLSHLGAESRRIEFLAFGERAQELIRKLKGKE